MLTNHEKIEILWKNFNGFSQTSTSKDVTNETIRTIKQLFSGDIWVYTDPISIPPVPFNPQYTKQYTGLQLTRDTSSSQSFFAYDTVNSVMIVDWIPHSYGLGYMVEVFDGNGNQVFPFDAVTPWYFDYFAGVLYFINPMFGANGVSGIPKLPLTINGYCYIGAKGSQTTNSNLPTTYPKPVNNITTPFTTPLMNVGDPPFKFTISDTNGYSIKLLSVVLDNSPNYYDPVAEQMVYDPDLFHCDCRFECHWDHTYTSTNPYSFVGLPQHLIDDGSYYNGGQTSQSVQFIDLITLGKDALNNCTYWQIIKLNKPGKVKFTINYIVNN